MAIVVTEAVKVPVYNSPLLAVCDGLVYIAYPYGMLTECGNQSPTPLRTTVLVEMCLLNLAVYIVDGLHIVEVPLTPGGSDTVPSLVPYNYIVGSAPAVPTLTFTGTSTLAAQTYYVKITSTGTSGPGGAASESLASAEVSLGPSGSLDKFLKVTVPASGGPFNVYVSLSPGTETLQATGIANSGNWTQSGPLTSTGATAPQGLTPTNCFLCCNWRGRFVLAGDSGNPQNFYMSRVGVPTDWNYAATDPAAAVAGNLSESGQIGEPIVALIPYTDDYMLIGCTNSLWMLQGDPANGGSIVRVSDQMGLVSPNSWCVDPAGTLYFIARGGLYSVRPIWEFYQPPQLLSGETYDQYFQAIINGSYYISMQWDVDAKYMHIFATPTNGTTQGVHLIFDQRNGGLWPQQYPLTQGPTASARYAANNVNGGQRAILLGGWDGYIRQWTLNNLDDDGTAIEAYAVLGPVRPATEASIFSGITIDFGELAAGAETAEWNLSAFVCAGPDAFSVTEGVVPPFLPSDQTFGNYHSIYQVPSTLDRRQKTYRQRFRGGWFSLVLYNDSLDTYFSFETAVLEFVDAGKNREVR